MVLLYEPVNHFKLNWVISGAEPLSKIEVMGQPAKSLNRRHFVERFSAKVQTVDFDPGAKT